MALLSLTGVSLAFGGPRLLDGVDFRVERGERVCLLGRNGEGKSTLLKLIQGELKPDDGELHIQQGLRIAHLPQLVPLGGEKLVAEVVEEGLDDSHGIHDHRIAAVLSRMGLDGELRFDDLSSGMKRRVLLSKALVADPDVLLLDEPTNHLDIDAIKWLEETLLREARTLIFVTHDRVFLTKLATRILELDRGRLFDWDCDYPTFLKRRDELLANEERQNALFDKRLAQEEVWIRKGIEARRTRNEGRVRALKAMRDLRQQRRDRQGTAKIQLHEAERSGAMVVEAKSVGFAYGEKAVIGELTTTIMRGDKIGIIGSNGAGKSTLIKLLLGDLNPTKGTIRLGTRLEVAYFDQLKTSLDEEKTVQKNITETETVNINGQPRHIVGYLQDFLFAPERSRTLVKFLSGGERSRLLLAKLFTRPSNVLVLDEPTNDLDVETLELLEGLLIDYQGTVLVVSHDRAFLNDVVTSTLAIDEKGLVKEYDGGYDDFLRQRATEMPAKSESSDSGGKGQASGATKEKSRKLTFKEQRELETLPAKIESLESAVSELHATMADPAFYRRESSEIGAVNAKLAAQEAELRQAYDRWELLESIANG